MDVFSRPSKDVISHGGLQLRALLAEALRHSSCPHGQASRPRAFRQAHSGEESGGFANYRQKLEGAREYARLEGIPWRVLVDAYDGTTHLAYSRAMADATFLIDADERVAFYNMWTHAPTLKRALDELLARDGRGVVAGGIDRTPHLLASLVDGYHGPAGADGAEFSSTTSAVSAPAACPSSAARPSRCSRTFALRAAPRGDHPIED